MSGEAERGDRDDTQVSDFSRAEDDGLPSKVVGVGGLCNIQRGISKSRRLSVYVGVSG